DERKVDLPNNFMPQERYEAPYEIGSGQRDIQRDSSSQGRRESARDSREANWNGEVFDAASVDRLGPIPRVAVGRNDVRTQFATDSGRRLCFRFHDAPWADVLRQYALAVGLKLRMEKAPEGRVNV